MSEGTYAKYASRMSSHEDQLSTSANGWNNLCHKHAEVWKIRKDENVRNFRLFPFQIPIMLSFSRLNCNFIILYEHTLTLIY